MLLGSSHPYPWLFLEENGRWDHDDGYDEPGDLKAFWSDVEIFFSFVNQVYSRVFKQLTRTTGHWVMTRWWIWLPHSANFSVIMVSRRSVHRPMVIHSQTRRCFLMFCIKKWSINSCQVFKLIVIGPRVICSWMSICRNTWREWVKDDTDELSWNPEWAVFRDMWRGFISGKMSNPSWVWKKWTF